MASGDYEAYRRRHEGELSRRRLLSYFVGGGALVAGVYFGLPKMAEMSPEFFLKLSHKVMRDTGQTDFESVQERTDRCIETLDTLVNEAKPISNFEQLNQIRGDLQGNYRLDADIFCPKSHNWEPIGTLEKPFMGTFNGQGHTIYGLMAEWPERDYVGMFGHLMDENFYFSSLNNKVITSVYNGDLIGAVYNLRLEGVKIRGNCHVGKLAGCSSRGFVGRVFASGTSEGFRCIGGNIGSNHRGVLFSSHNNGLVKGTSCVGGEIGRNSEGYIIDFLLNLEAFGQEDVGTLIGVNFAHPLEEDDFSEHIINSFGTIGADLSLKK